MDHLATALRFEERKMGRHSVPLIPSDPQAEYFWSPKIPKGFLLAQIYLALASPAYAELSPRPSSFFFHLQEA